MANMQMGDGSAVQVNAESLKELFGKMYDAADKLDTEIASAETFKPHQHVGGFRRCGECGRLRDDPLHTTT